MIKIFTGEDRVRAKKEITKFLGNDYEVIEGQDIDPTDLPSIFNSNTLFSDSRSILIRDLGANKTVFELLPNYLETNHKVAIFETKLDKRSKTYKTLKDSIEILDFALPLDPNLKLVFDIYKTAQTDGSRAIKMLEKIKNEEDPMMFFGLLVSQALKDFNQKQGTKQKTILKALSKVDLSLKSTSTDPWLLIESFLLQLSAL